jgi:KUP system potassium uptake protein
LTRPQAQRSTPTRSLVLGALGVVFGDIGTSPLYAFREVFLPERGIAVTEANVLAVLSLMFWAVTLVVSLKYVLIALRFDNRGEGGILALLALAWRLLRRRPRLRWVAGTAAVLGASFFFGDAVITPAISVLSAVEGLSVATPAFEGAVMPVTIAVLIALFAAQKRGTAGMGALFGPITIAWFVVLAGLGAWSIAKTPQVLAAIDPTHAVAFAAAHPGLTFVALGSVFLALTGGEALYADMGRFGPRPIRIAWFGLVFPALMLNYFGQGALILRHPAAVQNPFYFLAPGALLPPLVVLATAATVIASQAVISGAFSVAQQAARLGYFPRLRVQHTSDTEQGQIYVAPVNWLMLVLVLGLVLAFGSSSALAAAYGIAVSATMFLATALLGVVATMLRRRWTPVLLLLLAAIGCVELVFLFSNSIKIPEGGWFPLLAAAGLFTVLTTWRRGAEVIQYRESRRRVPLDGYSNLLASVHRVPGTAVFLSAERSSIPGTLLHNLKHNKVIHERVVLLRVEDEDVPRVAEDERAELEVLEHGAAYRATLHYGFREQPDVIAGLKLLGRLGLHFEVADTTFFLGRTTLAPSSQRTLFSWRRSLFRWMQKNSQTAAEYFGLPPDRTVELGRLISL